MIRDAVDTTTGEITSSEEVLLRCNSRLARVCPSCAALYRGDVAAIMREGLNLAAEAGETIVFLTLTAPSFGATHYVPPAPPPRLNRRRRAAWEKRNRRACPCGQHHAPGDRRWTGLPVVPSNYDYAGQVAWNAAAGRLWSRTADELTRVLGLDARLPYLAVAEWQRRGAIHLHAILRVPLGAELGLTGDPLRGSQRATLIEQEALAVTTTVDGEVIPWGRQIVAEVVRTEHQRHRTAGYLAKLVGYAVKDLTTPAGSSKAHNPELAQHHRRLDAAAAALRCGERPTRAPASAAEEARQAAWAMCEYDQRGGRPDGSLPFKVERSKVHARRCCRSLRHRQWGWRGHTVRKSRSWAALTITACRARRRGHAAVDEPLSDPSMSAVEVEWSRPAPPVELVLRRFEWEDLQARAHRLRAEAQRLEQLAADTSPPQLVTHPLL